MDRKHRKRISNQAWARSVTRSWSNPITELRLQWTIWSDHNYRQISRKWNAWPAATENHLSHSWSTMWRQVRCNDCSSLENIYYHFMEIRVLYALILHTNRLKRWLRTSGMWLVTSSCCRLGIVYPIRLIIICGRPAPVYYGSACSILLPEIISPCMLWLLIPAEHIMLCLRLH